MRTGLTKTQKITEITFDEKEALIHIRTHNTDLKNRLAAYAAQHPTECRQLDAEEAELRELTDSALAKLRDITDAEYAALDLTPDFDL